MEDRLADEYLIDQVSAQELEATERWERAAAGHPSQQVQLCAYNRPGDRGVPERSGGVADGSQLPFPS